MMDLNFLTDAFAQLPMQAAALSDRLVPTGKTLLGTILAVMMAWEGLKIAVEGADINQTIASFLNKTLVFGLVMLLLDSYPEFFGIYQGKPGGLLIGGFDQLSTQLGAPDIIGELPKILNQFMGMAGKILGFGNDPAGSTAPQRSWTDILTMLPDLILAYLARVAAAIVTLIAGAIFLAQMALSVMAVAIGAVVGPVLIPWILIPATSFLFDGWLKFMIVAGMWKLVGAVVYMLTMPVITAVTTKIATQNVVDTSFGDLTMVALGLLIVCVILAMMMAKIPDFAQALCSGGGVDGLSGRWASKAIMGGATSTARATGAAGSMAGKAAFDGAKGYNAARAAGMGKGQAMKAGGSYAAKSAEYRARSGGSMAEKPKLPKPPTPTGASNAAKA